MSTGTKLLLEVGPLAVFFGAYHWWKDAPLTLFGVEYQGVMVATLLFIPAILAALVASWILTRTLPRMAVVTAVVVVIFGGLTLALNDETFIKMKPTIVNGLFALGLAIGLMQGRSYLKYLLGESLPLSDAGWMIFTRRWCLFFLFMGALNELVWRTTSTDFWVNFRTFSGVPLTFAFMATQWPMLRRHGLDG